jgi:hypothetical protein
MSKMQYVTLSNYFNRDTFLIIKHFFIPCISSSTIPYTAIKIRKEILGIWCYNMFVLSAIFESFSFRVEPGWSSSGLGHPSTTYPSQVLRLPHTYPRPGVSSLSSLFLFGPPIGLVSQYIWKFLNMTLTTNNPSPNLYLRQS